MRTERLRRLPETLLRELKAARLERGWSQAELGRRVGLPQAHISAIERGKAAPRYDTLLDIVRVLGSDLLLVPRALVPGVQALILDHRRAAAGQAQDRGETPLYSAETSGESEPTDEA